MSTDHINDMITRHNHLINVLRDTGNRYARRAYARELDKLRRQLEELGVLPQHNQGVTNHE